MALPATSLALPGPPATDPRTPLRGPVVDVVVPVYNEEHVLEASVHRLHAHLAAAMPFSWRITIADNASTDGTAQLATALSRSLDRVRVLRLDRKGRGLALKAAWSSSDAAVVAYTDVDLSTGLDALLPLVAPLVSGHSDVAIGSRLALGASVARGPRREAISRAYNLILRTVFAVRFSDAQCGFKAVRTDAAQALLPHVQDDGWFFDTELLLLADHNELRIHEVPVDWVDDPDSRVAVVRTATDDLRGVGRMARTFATGGGEIEQCDYRRATVTDDMGRQLVTFGIIGAACTAVSLALFLLLRPVGGAVVANAAALSATLLANTWANHRYTFGRRDPRRRPGGHLRAAGVFAGGLVLSTVGLLAVGAAGGGLPLELLVLAVTWSATSLARFQLLRTATRNQGNAP